MISSNVHTRQTSNDSRVPWRTSKGGHERRGALTRMEARKARGEAENEKTSLSRHQRRHRRTFSPRFDDGVCSRQS